MITIASALRTRSCAFITLLILITTYRAPAQNGTGTDGPKPTGGVVRMPEVVVSGSLNGSAASGYRYEAAEVGPLGGAPIKDTPYSIEVTSGELIENRGVHDPVQALKTVPSVAPLMSPNGYSSMHRVMIRGLSASDQSEMRDGLTDRSFTWQPVEDIDHIDVLSGASGFLYGFSSIGGSINYVTRPPLDQPFGSLSAGVYNLGVCFGHVDLGGPVGTDALTYRLNLYAEDGETYMDGSGQERQLVSAAVRYRLFDDTHVTLRFFHQALEMDGLATYFDIKGIGYHVPDSFDPSRQYGQPWTYNDASKTLGDIAIDSRLNDVFSFRGAFRYGEMDRQYRFVQAKLLDCQGDYNEIYVDSSGNDESVTAAYALMDARFDTGPLAHVVTFGYTHWGFTFERGTNYIANLGFSNVDSPVRYDAHGHATGKDRRMETDSHNVLVGDRVEIGTWCSLLAGINYAMLDTRLSGAYLSPGTPPNSWQTAFTPAAGITLKPVRDLSVYASYMQGLEQGATAPGSAKNAYEVLDPTVSNQYEAGVKYTLWSRLDLTAAVFEIDKVNQYLDTADNVFKQDGEQTHRGFELTVSGKVCDRLTLVGGWTELRVEMEKSSNIALNGHTPVNIPDRQIRAYAEYEVPAIPFIPGIVTLSAGLNYYGRRPVDLPNAHYISDAITIDAGIRYEPTDHLTFNFTVSNLANKEYWAYYRSGSDGKGDDGLLLGDPRLFSASVKYTF